MKTSKKIAAALCLAGVVGIVGAVRGINEAGDIIKAQPLANLESHLTIQMNELSENSQIEKSWMTSPETQQTVPKYFTSKEEYIQNLQKILPEIKAQPNYQQQKKAVDDANNLIVKYGLGGLFSIMIFGISLGYIIGKDN